MDKVVHRGEIWMVNWNPGRGSEQLGTRPALIIQNDMGSANPKYGNVIVLAISTKSSPVPFHIRIQPNTQNGLVEISFIKCEQIMTISKERLYCKLGSLDENSMGRVWEAIVRILQ
jgi:mRNA interferase MazF